MITNKAEPDRLNSPGLAASSQRISSDARGTLFLLWVAAMLIAPPAHGRPNLGPWIPIFKGIDHAVGTNDPSVSGNFLVWQVVQCVRVDLTDPDIRLFTTPRAPNYAPETRETLTQTVPQFLSQYRVQVASDANFYSANPGGSDPSGSGFSCEVFGIQISSGVVVSAQTGSDAAGDPRYAALLFGTNNSPQFNFVNRPPGTNTTGIFTAITGYYPIVSNGVNIGAASISGYPDSWIHQRQPRTAFGVSQDHRYLFLMTLDGRQSGYSEGSLDVETAYWLIQAGAWNGINMDGGGSTSLYVADSTGSPVALNNSSYVAGYGHERYIGSHFGVFAKPLPGFINDVNVIAEDTAATVTWTTVAPATTQIEYGSTSDLGLFTTLSTALVTNHNARLTGLTPGTGYYFQIRSATESGSLYTSPNAFFVTTNYVTTNLDLTSVWSYSTADLDGVNWPATNYEDSNWDSGPGVFWADIRGSFQPGIPAPNTEMPADPNTSYPYVTYYFRAHFAFTNTLPVASLIFKAYLDDGAVFYLNGQEIARPFMPPLPTPIFNNTLASSYNCSSGNADCPYDFVVSGDLATNLVFGDNVLAVEVHNYSATSPDITFGASLATPDAVAPQPRLNISAAHGYLMLSWSGAGFILQEAAKPSGAWTDVPGPITSSPYSIPISASAQYFRLRK